ncbi:MAG TPA: hypothetical protein VNH84_17340 [Candidatus Saccharimonadales bacterium]|nr:hypothetical protein [Candidatus Saccharimonadales bacterium]
MSHTFQMFCVQAGALLVGLCSLFMRRTEKRSSWPTWLFVPLAIYVALPLGSYSKPPDELHPFYLVVQVLVLARWLVAVSHHERGLGWIFYLCILVAVPFVIGPALRSSPTSPSATLAFTGYSEDGHYALFSLTNHTRRYLDHSHAQIQLPTTTGWTNYYDMEEMSMCQIIGPLSGHQTAILLAALPTNQHRWKASVHYRVMPDYDSRWRMRLQPLLAFLNLDTSTNEITIVTGEFVR